MDVSGKIERLLLAPLLQKIDLRSLGCFVDYLINKAKEIGERNPNSRIPQMRRS